MDSLNSYGMANTISRAVMLFSALVMYSMLQPAAEVVMTIPIRELYNMERSMHRALHVGNR